VGRRVQHDRAHAAGFRPNRLRDRVAGVVAAEIIPVLLLAPLAGVVVDRVGPVRVMVGADLARVVLAAILPLVAGSVPAIYAVAFGMSAAAVFFNPAAGAALPALVEEDELVPA
jgi:MFS family permease